MRVREISLEIIPFSLNVLARHGMSLDMVQDTGRIRLINFYARTRPVNVSGMEALEAAAVGKVKL